MSLKEILTPIVNLKKDTFKTSQEFQTQKNRLLNNALAKRKVGTVTMLKYDADSEELTYSISYNEGFKELLEVKSKKSMKIKVKKELAKVIFSKKKTADIFAKLSFTGNKLSISRLYIRYKNKTFTLIANGIVNIGFMEVENISSQVKNVKLSFIEAKVYCKDSQYASKNDWRLPNLEELKLIYNNKSMLSFYESSYHWTATTYAGNTQNAYIVYFGNGYYGNRNKNLSYHFRCVRTK